MGDEMIKNNITRFTYLCNLLALNDAQAAYLVFSYFAKRILHNRVDKNTYKMYLSSTHTNF
jgi:hypothetical protein